MKIIQLPDATYGKLGRISAAWAKIEFSVDLMNGVIFSWHKARAYEKRIPLAMESKLKFLRRAANRLPSLAMYQKDMISLAAQGLEFRDGRNALAHGVPTSYGPDGATYAVLKNLNDTLAISKVPMSEEFLSEFMKFSETLATQSFNLCHHFIDQWIDESRDADGDLPSGKH